MQRLNIHNKWTWFLKAGREKWLGSAKLDIQNPNAMYLLLSGSSSACKITSWIDLHVLSTIHIFLLCMCPGDHLVQTVHLPLCSQILTPFTLDPFWLYFCQGEDCLEAHCLCELFCNGSLCSPSNKKNTLPAFNSRAEFSYCKQTFAGTWKIMWQEIASGNL